jgi:hypothetical protein
MMYDLQSRRLLYFTLAMPSSWPDGSIIPEIEGAYNVAFMK